MSDDMAFRYEMVKRAHNGKRGRCIIINNQNFVKMPDRPGSEVDAANMKELFMIMGYDVTILVNQTAQQMIDIALRVSKADHKDADSFVMFILSHGKDQDVIYGVTCGVKDGFSLHHMLDNFKHCNSLRGKPKLFFIQACRGGLLDDGAPLPIEYETDGETESNGPEEPPVRIPLAADFLYAYSTPPDHYAFRNNKDGAWFIQAIYQIFSDNWRAMEIQQMMTRVNHKVAYGFTSSCSKDRRYHDKKQVSSVVSMLTKELYFTP